MTYDGVIGKIFNEGEDKIFLFLLEDKKVKDGINISDDSDIYQNLSYDTLQVVDVILKDGTIDADINLDDFILGKYGQYDIFIHIKDVMTFKLGKKDINDDITKKSIENVILDGEFDDIVNECLEMSKIKKEDD